MLDDVLRQVSKNCLRGQPVPEALGAPWEAQLADRSPIADDRYGKVELVSEYDDEFFEGYDAESCGAAVARAYGRMFQQIAFIGRAKSPITPNRTKSEACDPCGSHGFRSPG